MRILSTRISFIASTTCPPHRALSLFGALCSRESRRSLYRRILLIVCLFVCSDPALKKWKSRSPIMITSESRRASPLSLRAVKLWLSLISFSPFVFFDHPHYWGRIQIVTFPPGRKSGCLHTPRVCSPRTVEGGTSNRPSCPWPKNLFQARGSVKVQNRKRVSVTFENICKRAQCFFPRPFGSAAPHLSFTIKNCNNLPPFCERITWEMR